MEERDGAQIAAGQGEKPHGRAVDRKAGVDGLAVALLKPARSGL
ncbi:hypothetical protein [Aromatoleum diolicum]|nr:hypothetical protein [Aromatoleum diolicum]